MTKRLVAAVLWFLSIWFAVDLVGDLMGRPTDVGAVLGALIAGFVWMDPTGALWGPKTPARSRAGRTDGLGAIAPSR